MANEQDDDFFDDDDLDEETLLVLEQAEKHHASISLTASQAPPASSLVNRSTSVPVKSLSSQQQRNAPAFPPPSQYQSRQYQHQPLASQQRASSARPAVPAVNHAVVQPMYQQQRQQQQPPQHFKAPQPVKQYPSSTNGNAVAGPSRYVARQPVKPKYKDDFPDVEIDAHGKGYRVRSSASAAPLASASGVVNGHPPTSLPNNETESLRTQLAELQRSLEAERKARQSKEGEVKILRQKSEKLNKEYETQLQSEQSKIAPLQERINKLEAALSIEQSKHSSEMIFQKQEIESKYRASGIAHLKSARKQQIQNSQMMSQRSSSQIASPRKQFKTQKGFQNSFAEPMQSTQYAGSSARLPSSPSDGRAPPIPQAISPRSLNKGKQREIDPSSEMDIHDLSDMELQGDLLDLTVDNEDNDEEAELELTPSNREEITAFLFDHLPHSPTCTSPTLFSLVNFDFPSDTEPTRLQEHRGICQSFFHCFSIRQTRDGSNAKNQESVFIRRLLIDILSLVRFFHAEELTRNEAMLGIDLILDLCQKFPSVVFSLDTDRFYYDYLAKQLFETIGKCINTERARLKAREAPLPKKTNAVTSGWSASKEESTRQEARRKILIASFEKEVEAYSCSLLHLIQYLALRPDPARLTHIDTFLRDTSCLAFFMDARREPRVHLEALFLVTLLTSQPSLFRSLLSSPFQDPDTSDAPAPPAAAAGRNHYLPFVEQTAGFLSYRIASPSHNQAVQQLALMSLSNLVVAHADGTPLLNRSPSLVQRLVVRISQDASLLYDEVSDPAATADLVILLRIAEASMRLLHHLVLSQDGLKSLSAHLSERPFGRDYLVTGVGRIACTEVPEWISSHALGSQLDQLANLGFELLEDVLSPDEVDDLYSLCRDEDEDDGTEEDLARQEATDRNEEEEMAAQNIDAMES